MDEQRKNAYRIGQAVLFLLAIVTVGEYLLGTVASDWWAPLLGLAVLKAFFVMRDYMHLSRVFAGDEETHA